MLVNYKLSTPNDVFAGDKLIEIHANIKTAFFYQNGFASTWFKGPDKFTRNGENVDGNYPVTLLFQNNAGHFAEWVRGECSLAK